MTFTHTLGDKISYANVAATLALLVAVSGTSYAAVTLPRNSVGTQQLKADAVKSTKVKNGSLRARDFRAGELPAGPAGPQGTFGAVTVQTEVAPADLADGANANYGVFCLAGQRAIAGGGRGDDTLSEETILTNTRPAISSANQEPPLDGQGFTGWRITVVNPVGGAAAGIRPQVWVVCVPDL